MKIELNSSVKYLKVLHPPGTILDVPKEVGDPMIADNRARPAQSHASIDAAAQKAIADKAAADKAAADKAAADKAAADAAKDAKK